MRARKGEMGKTQNTVRESEESAFREDMPFFPIAREKRRAAVSPVNGSGRTQRGWRAAGRSAHGALFCGAFRLVICTGSVGAPCPIRTVFAVAVVQFIQRARFAIFGENSGNFADSRVEAPFFCFLRQKTVVNFAQIHNL